MTTSLEKTIPLQTRRCRPRIKKKIERQIRRTHWLMSANTKMRLATSTRLANERKSRAKPKKETQNRRHNKQQDN